MPHFPQHSITHLPHQVVKIHTPNNNSFNCTKQLYRFKREHIWSNFQVPPSIWSAPRAQDLMKKANKVDKNAALLATRSHNNRGHCSEYKKSKSSNLISSLVSQFTYRHDEYSHGHGRDLHYNVHAEQFLRKQSTSLPVYNVRGSSYNKHNVMRDGRDYCNYNDPDCHGGTYYHQPGYGY